MRIAFLYTELADYTIECLRALRKNAPVSGILVIHFPINPEAPFRFDFSGIGEFACVNDFAGYNAFQKKLLAFKPDKIVCAGWVNKWYLRFCLAYRNKAQCILALDNHWQNTLKQRLLTSVSPFLFKRVFHKLWIPGSPQLSYAHKLGYTDKRIITGFYSCDLERYNLYYNKFKAQKKQKFPRRLLCVARYIPSKNYQYLWETFIKWKEEQGGEWELWCAGTGEQFDQRIEHPAIRHLGFVQKNEWEEVIRQTGVFILPSLSEPWAVAVHEFAAAGFPLLLSSCVGAASQFLSLENGLQFDPRNQHELENCFKKISRLSDEQLCSMSETSNRLAQVIAPDKWASTLVEA